MNLSEKTSFSFESEPAEGEVIGVDACALDVLEAPVVKEEEREREREREEEESKEKTVRVSSFFRPSRTSPARRRE